MNGAIESLESTVITDHVTDTTNLDHPDPCPDQKVFSFSHIFKLLALSYFRHIFHNEFWDFLQCLSSILIFGLTSPIFLIQFKFPLHSSKDVFESCNLISRNFLQNEVLDNDVTLNENDQTLNDHEETVHEKTLEVQENDKTIESIDDEDDEVKVTSVDDTKEKDAKKENIDEANNSESEDAPLASMESDPAPLASLDSNSTSATATSDMPSM